MTEVAKNNETGGKTERASRWWKWPVRLLAGIGALSLVVIGLAVAVAPGKSEPTRFSADEMIDQIMLRTYGKYSEAEKGWMYVNEHRQAYVMRVVHRAKIVDDAGNEELYFLASGDFVDTGSHAPITGAFKVMADPEKADGSLVEISEPFMDGFGRGALSASDIRFEALSDKTFGWVLKARDHWLGEDAGSSVTNVVLAPNAQTVAVVASFPAMLKVEVGDGCAAAQAQYADWQQARSGQAAAAPSSPASDAASDDEAESNEEEDGPPLRCTDATFSYKTGPVPEDGFVTFTVTGNGPVNGENLSSKTWKLVFDHKSFSYLVPEELAQPHTGY